MAEASIKWGEVERITVRVTEAGEEVVLDETWAAACRVVRDKDQCVFADIPMTIADGVATGSIDTRGDEYSPGLYIYDVRLTDPNGDDFWTEQTRLTLSGRKTPASTE
jgi:hypothetical protein